MIRLLVIINGQKIKVRYIMSIFELKYKSELRQIEENPFKLEKDIQKLTEKNLEAVFSLSFVKSEFSLNTFRIDTLAYDHDSNAFVIIEYKKDRNFSVIDQGYAYLSLMLNNKADFILEYNETQEKTLKREDVDWSQSRIIFISPSFTNYQKEAINFKDLPIELWEIKRYKNNTVSYSQIRATGAQESVKTISRQDDTVKKVSKEIKVYTEEEHLQGVSDKSIELYEKLKSSLLNYENIELKPKKYYLAFVSKTNVVDVHLFRSSIKIWLNMRKGELDDPKNIARDVSNIGHWGNGDYEISISNDENFEYIMSLIKQSYDKNKK